MLLHIDRVKFKVKPTGAEIGGIKSRFTKSASIKDMTAKQLADCLTAGQTVQPGCLPFFRKQPYKGLQRHKRRRFCEADCFHERH